MTLESDALQYCMNNSPIVANDSPSPIQFTREYFNAKFDTDSRWVERGIVALYRKQTEMEKRIGSTVEHNNQGFSGWTANSGTYYAKWILSGKNLDGKHLDRARKIVKHHCLQIVRIAQEGKD